MSTKVQEVYRTPNRRDQKRKYPYLIIIKMLNIQNKKRLLKATWKKEKVPYKGKPIRIMPDFSMETLKPKMA